MSNFKSFAANEFENYIKALNISRSISRIQLHHTYSPSYAQFTGKNHIALQTGMQRHHIKNNGWSDIAQHFTVFPDGVIVTGRSLEMVPAGIKGANSGAICIECLGNFDKGEDVMTEAQKDSIIEILKILVKKFSLEAKKSIIYHGWWSAEGKALGDYSRAKSAKTCPGTNFFGGNSRTAFEQNLLPLILNGNVKTEVLKSVTEINDIVWELANAGIITDSALWIKKCNEDINVYWLCRKMANQLRGTA